MQDRPWYVLHVNSNFESRVAQHLVVREVEHYLPTYKEKVKWSDRVVVVERALFSGYVFARIATGQRLTVITVPGVVRVLGDDDRNMVSSEELERIRLGLTQGLPLRPHRGMVVGTKVRVRRGVFQGAEGLVDEIRKQCRVVLKLTTTQQCFSLEVEAGDLEVVKDSRSLVGALQACASA